MTNAIIPLLYAISVLNFFGKGGLIQVMDGVFFGYLWLTPLLTFIGSADFWVKTSEVAAIKTFDEKINKSLKGVFLYTQHEANEAFKKRNFVISSRYANLMKTFAVTLFYLPIMPYCIFYSALGLLIQYHAEKVKINFLSFFRRVLFQKQFRFWLFYQIVWVLIDFFLESFD